MILRIICAIVAIVTMTMYAGACSPPAPEGGATALVVGYRHNSPEPEFVGQVQDRIRAAQDRGDDLVFVSVTGNSTSQGSSSLACPYSNNGACNQFKSETSQELSTLLTKYPADHTEADLLAAINIGRDSISSARGHKQIIVIDNGISTAGDVDLRDLGVLDGDIKDLAKHYAEQGLIHDLDGYQVTFSGLGQSADDQQIPEPYPAKVQQFWQAMVEAAHGTAEMDVTPLPAKAESVDFPSVTVATVPPPVQPTDICEQIKLPADRLGFVANESTLREPEKAKVLLANQAPKLRDSGLAIFLTGTTAYDDGPGHRLSNDRSSAVKTVLVDLGVPADKIITQGVGINWSGYADPKGNPIREREMRLVILQVSCPHS